MNTISDSLIEKLDELYPKTKPELTFGTTTQYLTYDENSLMIKTAGNTNTYPLPIYVQKIAEQNNITRVAVLDQMMIKESTYCAPVNFKQYIDNRIITPIFDLEFRMKEYIRQEIDKLKCSPSTPT